MTASGSRTSRLHTLRLLLCAGAVISAQAMALGAPKSEAWEIWRPAAIEARLQVNHQPWGTLLATYLNDQHPSGINRFDYSSVTSADKARLDNYIAYLSGQLVAELTVAQQQAYWINLYNALTVRLVLEHPGIDSIREIKSGFFSAGPWDREVITVNSRALTLNDIEHRILRPLYKDARVHFAVNCASLGCPNLLPEPFTADTLNQQLEFAAREFVNHSRGVSIAGSTLTLSSIFTWYQVDFGNSQDEMLAWLARYARPALAARLASWQDRVRYQYDWALNAPQ